MDLDSRNLVLDLHGRRYEDAISEVTLFLERIRCAHAAVRSSLSATTSPAAAAARGGGMYHEPLYATIITGSGSHSSHGPVLRSAVQRLLQKRGMEFHLGRGGGAFQVDALSGWDLYDEGPSTDSKVMVMDQEQFHQMAPGRTDYLSSAKNSAAVAQRAAARRESHPRSASSPGVLQDTYNDPLPSQVAAEDAALQAALHISIKDSQTHRNLEDRVKKDFESAYRRAVSESQAEHIAYDRRKLQEEIEVRRALSMAFQDYGQKNAESQDENRQSSGDGTTLEEEDHILVLKKVAEQSLIDEDKRREEARKRYELELEIALKKSEQAVHEYEEKMKSSEEDILRAALEKSLLEEERVKTSEEELLQKVLEQSLKEEEIKNRSEEDYMEKVIAQSLEEERNSKKDELLERVLQLSLEESKVKSMDEETALRIALEMSAGGRVYDYYQENEKMPSNRK